MNQDQGTMLVRAVMGILSGYLISKGISQGQITDLTNLIITALGVLPGIAVVVWGWFNHSDAGKVKVAESIDGAKLVVGPVASGPALAAALDDKRPNVITLSQAQADPKKLAA